MLLPVSDFTCIGPPLSTHLTLPLVSYADPGGQIFVTNELLKITDDDELVAVLGHEVGHVLYRHSQKRLIRNQLGSLLLDAILHGDGDDRAEPLPREVAGLLLRQASELATLSYSRQNEYEADQTGWYLSAGIGGTRDDALQSFLAKLSDSSHTAWHHTHPSSEDRIAAIAELSRRQRAHGVALLPPAAFAGPAFGSTLAASTLLQWLPIETQTLMEEGVWSLASLLEEMVNYMLNGENNLSRDRAERQAHATNLAARRCVLLRSLPQCYWLIARCEAEIARMGSQRSATRSLLMGATCDWDTASASHGALHFTISHASAR